MLTMMTIRCWDLGVGSLTNRLFNFSLVLFFFRSTLPATLSFFFVVRLLSDVRCGVRCVYSILSPFVSLCDREIVGAVLVLVLVSFVPFARVDSNRLARNIRGVQLNPEI